MRLEEVESKLGYTFKDKTLLKRALTLASASDDNNQLLEFFRSEEHTSELQSH